MSSASPDGAHVRQHLIDPEICIRCNTCEATCPVGAISHDDRNYVVDASRCEHCMACVAPCPTGSIDHWHLRPQGSVYSLAEQLGWDELPPQPAGADLPAQAASAVAAAPTQPAPAARGATRPPWSAAQPSIALYGPPAGLPPVTATVTGNLRVTDTSAQHGLDGDTHHLVLDFGAQPFPVLEGQSIGVLPPGLDSAGRPHHMRQYSVASPRNGERAGYNNLSLTLKRVLQDRDGRPVRGVASNYLCDLQVGDTLQVVGPYGSSFLMPNHPGSHIVMICTGTGSAPMRAMTEWRRRQRGAANAAAGSGRLLLFFGARSPQELPYFGPLQKLPRDFIDIHFAFSRLPGQAKRHVQDAMREQAGALAPLLADDNAYFYVCGVKGMEDGVLQALREIADGAGLAWPALAAALVRDGRLHLETY
ncbi:MAG: benzoyl-CoA 2,3-epoxidase subunit BoxA [Rubrivivax sp.]|nr:benzoyl-CoA 2,3-epoxidase subunit BoxA [Rubrivivax sp.]